MVRANAELLRGPEGERDDILTIRAAPTVSEETLERVAEHEAPPLDDGGPAVSVSDQVSILLASIEGMNEGDFLPPEGNVVAQAITDEVGDLGGYSPPLRVGQARVLCQVALAAVGEAEDEADDDE